MNTLTQDRINEFKATLSHAQAILDKFTAKGIGYIHLSRTDKRMYAKAKYDVHKYTMFLRYLGV